MKIRAAKSELEEFRRANLKPGEVSPGVSRVMLRKGKRVYLPVLIETPRNIRTDRIVVFTNGKTARIVAIKTWEEEEEGMDLAYLWITVESGKDKKGRAYRERLKEAGL